jgi:pyruvate,water dikinase
MAIIWWFNDISESFIEETGIKAFYLAQLYQKKFNVPPGFIIQKDLFEQFIKNSNIENKLSSIYVKIKEDNLEHSYKQIKEIILKEDLSEEIKETIKEAYKTLNIDLGGMTAEKLLLPGNPNVALRHSPMSANLDFLLSKQKSTILNIKRVEELYESLKKCWISLFTPELLKYRLKREIGLKLGVSLLVQKMIDSEKSGVAYSANPEGPSYEILIKACLGFGDIIEQESLQSDLYIVDKENLDIKEQHINKQEWQFARDFETNETTKILVSEKKSGSKKLNDYEIIKVARITKKIESLFEKPQQVEWAIEGDEYFIFETKPFISVGEKTEQEIENKVDNLKGEE